MSNENRTLLDAAVAPGTPVSRRPGARRLLEDCWTSIRNAVEPRITDVVLEALGPIARSENEDVAKPAKIALSRDRAFVQAYSDALQSEFRAAVADFVAHRLADSKATDRKSLSLVDYGDMEFSTLIESSGARIRNAVDDEYTSVKLRVANLVREPDLRDGDHPFRPGMFLRAAHQALEKVGVPKEDLLRLTHCFDAPLIAPVRAAYAAVDHHLASQGVSAELARTTITRNSALGRNTVLGRNSMLGVPTNTGLGMPLTGGGMHFAGGLSAEQVLQGLYQRMQLLPQAGFAAPGMMGDPRQAAPGHYVPAPTLGGTSALRAMQALQGMPTMQGVPSVPGGATVLIEPGLLNALNEIQKLGAIAMSAVQMGRPAPDAAINVAELRGKLTETASKQVDKLTIEIVGLLFDRINQDKHVPDEVKHLLQRLQFPLIKVALTDPELFVSPQHPARLLLDRIASTSIGWTSAGEDNQRYLAEVQKVVHAVLAATEDGLGAFEKSLAAFEQYLAEEKTRDDDPVARAKRALAEAESREVMAINATIQVRSAFDGVQIESYLRDFLLETWVRVLVAASLREKDKPGQVQRYLRIVPDLVWSVQPKINPDDRKRLVRVIPPVLATLREGVMLIDWPQPKMQEFFSKLMNSHAQAVKALELAHGNPGAAFEPSTLSIKLDGIRFDAEPQPADGAAPLHVSDDVVRHVIAKEHAPVNHLTLPPDAAATVHGPDDAQVDEIIARWKRGDWFNLRVGDVTERVRLRWVSPRKTLYLFTPADGRQAHSLSPETLRGYLRSGRMQPVESVPLFDRAVHAVMQDLQGAAVGAQ
ncbi:MAG: DUF1631 family protein [Pseudomonadota bacterium]